MAENVLTASKSLIFSKISFQKKCRMNKSQTQPALLKENYAMLLHILFPEIVAFCRVKNITCIINGEFDTFSMLYDSHVHIICTSLLHS